MSTSEQTNEAKSLPVSRTPMSAGLILLHTLIIFTCGTFLVIPWIVNPAFIDSPIHVFEVGLFGIAFLSTTISLFMNFGWWIPLAMVGMAIGSQFPSAWTGGSFADYYDEKCGNLMFGMYTGGLLGFCLEAVRRGRGR